MHDKPYHNEPSFEDDDGSGDVERYNEKIAHETLRVAVVDTMEDTLQARAPPNGATPAFADLRKQLLIVHMCNYLDVLNGWIASANSAVHDGRQFKMMPFECAANCMDGTFGWKAVRERLLAVKAQLDAEHDGWRAAGVEQAALLRSDRAIGLAPSVRALAEQFDELAADGVDNVSISSSKQNALVWELTLLGPENTLWEGGYFQVEFVFPPSWPELCARSRARAHHAAPRAAARGRPCLVTCAAAAPASHARARAHSHRHPRSARAAQLAARALCHAHVPPEHQQRRRAVPQHAAPVAQRLGAAAHCEGGARRGARAAH